MCVSSGVWYGWCVYVGLIACRVNVVFDNIGGDECLVVMLCLVMYVGYTMVELCRVLCLM